MNQIIEATTELGWEFVLPDRAEGEGTVGMLIGDPDFVEDFMTCKKCGATSEEE